MSRSTDEKFAEIAIWWNYHRKTLPRENLALRCDFLEKACNNLVMLMAMMTKDMEQLEGPRRKLFLPTGMRIEGDVRKFG